MSPALASLLLTTRLQSTARDGPSATEEPGPTLEGEATVGFRLRKIRGSEAQYEEDVNLDEGLFLRSAHVSAHGLDGGPLQSFELGVEGLGDPFATYRLDALGGPWSTHASYDHDRFVGNAQVDQHGFDIERRRGRLDLDYRSDDPDTRSTFGLQYGRREGLYEGSRSINLDFIAGFPALREETTRGASAGFATRVGGWLFDLTAGIESLAAEDRRQFDLPAPGFPGTNWSEDFSADTDGAGHRGALEVERELTAGATLALGFAWQSTDLDGNETAAEEGFVFSPDAPFLSTSTGELEFVEREHEGRVGVTFALSESTDLGVGFTRHVESGSGDLARLVVRDEFTGDPPSVSAFLDTADHESALDLVQLEMSTALGERTQLDLDLEWGHEDVEVRQVVDGVTVRSFDGTLREFGGEAAVSLALDRGYSLDIGAGHHVLPVETALPGVGFDFEDDRQTFVRCGARRRGERNTVGCTLRLERRENEALTSESDAGSVGADYSWTDGRLRLDVFASFAAQELRSETSFVFFEPGTGFEVVPGVARFDGQQATLGGALECELDPFRPRLEWSAALGRGDSEFEYWTAAGVLPWRLRECSELGVEARALDFAGSGVLGASDYRVLLLAFTLRVSFGPRSF